MNDKKFDKKILSITITQYVSLSLVHDGSNLFYCIHLLSYDWDPQPSGSGRGYYISRIDGGIRRGVEKWKGGWTDQQGSCGRLTQTQEVPLLCGKCFIITLTVTASLLMPFVLSPHWKDTQI